MFFFFLVFFFSSRRRHTRCALVTGVRRVLFRSIAGKDDAMMKPTMPDSRIVTGRLANGMASVNGSTPRMENQITTLEPKRSPIGPPITVPSALAPRKERKSVVKGKRVSVSVDVGGSRIIKNKKLNERGSTR